MFRLIMSVIFLTLSINTAKVFAVEGGDYTLEPAFGKKYLTEKHRRKLTGDWDKNGVIRLAVISDHNFHYDFWSGVQLIDVATEKLYNVNAVECYISFCLYVGKVPPGKYFINNLYAHSYIPSSIPARSEKKTAPIRNSMGAFEVKEGSITDLGMIGIYSGVESGGGEQFNMSFQGYHPDISLLFNELYRGYSDKLSSGGAMLGWVDTEWEDAALTKARAERMFFADFSAYQEIGGRLFFPTALGAIYILDLKNGYSHRNVGTPFMLNTLVIDNQRWIAGGEGGRIYVSGTQGADWEAVDAFARDEVVFRIFNKDKVLYAVTLSQRQKAVKLYRCPPGELRFSILSSHKFKPEGKSSGALAKLNQAIESLSKIYFNRTDLKKIRINVLEKNLLLKFNDEKFMRFDFKNNRWKSFTPFSSSVAHFAQDDVIYMVSGPHKIPNTKSGLWKEAERKYGRLSETERTQLRVTSVMEYSSDLTKIISSRQIFAGVFGGFYVKNNGEMVALLSLFENLSDFKDIPTPQICSLTQDMKSSLVYLTANAGFFYDSDLHSVGSDTLLIDRVAPRVYSFSAGNDTGSYRLYESAYSELKAIAARKDGAE